MTCQLLSFQKNLSMLNCKNNLPPPTPPSLRAHTKQKVSRFTRLKAVCLSLLCMLLFICSSLEIQLPYNFYLTTVRRIAAEREERGKTLERSRCELIYANEGFIDQIIWTTIIGGLNNNIWSNWLWLWAAGLISSSYILLLLRLLISAASLPAFFFSCFIILSN